MHANAWLEHDFIMLTAEETWDVLLAGLGGWRKGDDGGVRLPKYNTVEW